MQKTSFKLALAQCSYLDTHALQNLDACTSQKLNVCASKKNNLRKNNACGASGDLCFGAQYKFSDISLNSSTVAYKEKALDTIENFAQRASNAHANMIVFPEYMMTPYDVSSSEYFKAAEPIDGEFTQSICACAKKNNIWIVCSINERNLEGLPFNTLVVIDNFGSVVSHYRKIHLFDSYQSRESDKICAGTHAPKPISAPFACFGLGICYDLRFPEIAREQCVQGAQVMLYPAAWMSGVEKIEQWHALLRCRAIENTAYVAGVCRCDEQYIGNTCLYDPNGKLLAQLNQKQDLIVADIDLGYLSSVREKMPTLKCAKKQKLC